MVHCVLLLSRGITARAIQNLCQQSLVDFVGELRRFGVAAFRLRDFKIPLLNKLEGLSTGCQRGLKRFYIRIHYYRRAVECLRPPSFG